MNNNFQIVKKEVINAYSDCNSLAKESRQLDFLASRPVSVKEAEEIMALALESGYNVFEPELIGKLPQSAKVWLAREGSVCLYLDMPIDDQTQKELVCDEYDQVDKRMVTNHSMISDMIGKYRIWWD